MTYAEFVAKVKENLPVDADRLNIGVVTSGTSFIDNKLRSALIELQHLIDPLRVGHETIYRPDDMVLDGLSSLGVRPEGAAIIRAWYAKTGQPATRKDVGTYDWVNRFDLSSGSAVLGGCSYIIALDPNSSDFVLYPKLEEGYQLHLEWNGLKLVFADSDELPAMMDEKVAECVAERGCDLSEGLVVFRHGTGCEGRELNPHARRTPEPKSGASANSATFAEARDDSVGKPRAEEGSCQPPSC